MFLLDIYTLGLLAILLLPLAALAIFVALIFGWPYLLLQMRKRLNRRMAEINDRGVDVPLTLAARLGLGRLPLDVALTSRIGESALPDVSAGSITMRPTIGLRLSSLGLTALLVAITLSDPDHFGLPDAALIGIAALVAHAVLFTQLFFVRYDTEAFTVLTQLFQSRSTPWSDVISIQDDGNYLYLFRTTEGRTVRVLKYTTGISDFLAYASDQMAYHKEIGLQSRIPPVGPY